MDLKTKSYDSVFLLFRKMFLVKGKQADAVFEFRFELSAVKAGDVVLSLNSFLNMARVQRGLSLRS